MNIRYTLRARKFRSRWDPAEIEWIMKNVGVGATALDIGAHKGGWTYWIRKAVGATGRVIAFEPQPTLHDYLKGVFASRFWKNVALEDVALSNDTRSTRLFVPAQLGSTAPGASLKEDVLVEKPVVYSTPVKTTTLDLYLEEAAIRAVDFVKVDVEGSELDLLEGARAMLRNSDASWIIECESRHVGEDGVMKLFSTMEAEGYGGCFFSGMALIPVSEFSFTQHQLRDSDGRWDHPGYCNNFLFTRSR